MVSIHRNKFNTHQEIIGLIPAGGEAFRLQPLPCSKEIFPVGFYEEDQELRLRPKAVCSYLLDRMSIAGVNKAFIVLRKGKWDIPTYLGDGKMYGFPLAYLFMDLPFGVPFTLDQAFPFVKDALVVFGFPDIIFEPRDAFPHLLNRNAKSSADVVLGLFPAHRPNKMDMVELDENNRITAIHIKPPKTDLRYTWIIAVWNANFTSFMHQYLLENLKTGDQGLLNAEANREMFIGEVIHAAITDGLQVEAEIFSDGRCLDIGTPEDLVKAIQKVRNNEVNLYDNR